MKIKITGLILVLLLAISGSTCKKKISKYPFDMYGVWFAGDSFCGNILEIERSDEGKIFELENSFCASFSKTAKGKVKFKKDVLYIGKEKYTIFSEPKTVVNDSIEAPDENNFGSTKWKYRKILARMTLETKGGVFSFKETYNFVKYVNY